ncbi:DNA-3-methyladenine glycosylase I [Lactobacillus sp. CBA3605]|uniref:DNA-3-methyladenine glycosylase I n=1 Tax=Lactobacillus sp. CBA3605 TaxID=2099788 RepID=UPI000CFAE0F8|nr:DNA-3-methyladenine glycosylase I [Lactobacillus sp. CBA3605]AVK61314.1 DNA-3-methyladenine glycosylase I [Lactobacillus sp. CBA3605]
MIASDDFNDFAATGVNDYHQYFGTPTHDDHVLFELLIVGIFQVGLSWQAAASQLPVLRQQMAGLRVEVVAGYDDLDLERLLQAPNVMHNGRKLRAIIQDAQAIVKVQRQYGSFEAYLWAFVAQVPFHMLAPDNELPTQSPLGTRIAADLHRHDFTFVGPVVTQMFLLAAGIIQVD